MFFFFLFRDKVPEGESLPHKSPLTYSWSLGETGAIKDCLERLNEPLCWWFKGIVFLPSLCLSSSDWERFSWRLSSPYNEPVMSQISQNLNLNIKSLCRNHEKKSMWSTWLCALSNMKFLHKTSKSTTCSWQESGWWSVLASPSHEASLINLTPVHHSYHIIIGGNIQILWTPGHVVEIKVIITDDNNVINRFFKLVAMNPNYDNHWIISEKQEGGGNWQWIIGRGERPQAELGGQKGLDCKG